jgi:molybdenum cofactor cytidylyltransferase
MAKTLRSYHQATSTVFVAVRQREPWLNDLVHRYPGTSVITVDETQGIGDTLAMAVGKIAAQDIDALLIALADMPWVQAATLNTLTTALAVAPIVVPTYQGEWGHPVGFDKRYFPALKQCAGDRGARGLLERERARMLECPVDDHGVLSDVDRLDDLRLRCLEASD